MPPPLSSPPPPPTPSQAKFPLRTAIIGLSASAVTSWAASAHLPALQHPSVQKYYIITALCNSSVSAAEAAITTFNLPPSTKAYGSPEDLADDPDIDVVICNTRVDRHFETVAPSIVRGKMVYVEWPVSQSVETTEELGLLAARSGSLVAVGLQGRWAPVVVRMRELVESGRLGRVLSSEVRGFGGTKDRASMPVGLKYFGEWVVGGNPMTIQLAHKIDYVQSVLGEYVEGTTHAHTQIQRPQNKVLDGSYVSVEYAAQQKLPNVVEVFDSDVPDLIVVTGSLAASDFVVQDATLSARFRRGQPFKGDPSLVWTVNCEHGEIRLIVPSGVALQAAAYDEPLSLQIHHFANGDVEDVPWDWSQEQSEVPVVARAVMSTLIAFAKGDKAGYTDLTSATKRARQIDAWVTKGKW